MPRFITLSAIIAAILILSGTANAQFRFSVGAPARGQQGLGFHGNLVSISNGSRVAQVTALKAGGIAQRAGVKPGDIILSINNQPPGDAASNNRAVLAGGGQVLIVVKRNGNVLALGNRNPNLPLPPIPATTRRARGLQKSSNQSRGYWITNKAKGTSFSLGVYGAVNNTQVRVVDTGYFDNQHWKLTPLADGCYRMTSTVSGPALSLGGNIAGNRSAVQMVKTSNRLTGQFWRLTLEGGDYYRLTNDAKGTGMSLDIDDDPFGDDESATVTMAETDIFSDSQLWKVTRAN